jgi:HisJ family histidinol phosphate phosphatase
LNDSNERDPRLFAIPDTHGHAKGEHKPYAEERPLPLTARMLFLWFYHACRRGYPRFLMVADHMNYLTFEDPAAVNLVRRALKLAQAGDLYGAAETATVDVGHAAVVSEGLRRGMRYSIGAEVDNDPRSRPDAQNIVDAMRPDAIIRSVHFIPITHPVLGENWPWPFDNPEFKDLFETVGTEQTWETYVNALVDAIERLPGHIVGHFFVPAVFGHWPDDAKLDAYEDRVLDAAGARGMAVEFNTRFLYRDHTDDEKRRYIDANKRFLRKAKDRGVMIAIGSDAHSPKDQGGAFSTVLDVLDELDINEIVFPLAGTLRRVALRVVREPEPEPPPAPPTPEPVAEPQRAHERTAAPADGAGEAAKPVRKARPSAKATRPPETSPDRPRERPETPAAGAEAAPPEPQEPPIPASAEPADAVAESSPPQASAEDTDPPVAAQSDGEPASGANGAPPSPPKPPRTRKSRAKPKPADAPAEATPAAAPISTTPPEAEPVTEPAAEPVPTEPARPAEPTHADEPARASKPVAKPAAAAKPVPAAKVVAAPKPAAPKPAAPKPPAPKAAVKPAAAKPPPAKAAANARTAKPAAASSKSAPARTAPSKSAPVKAGPKKPAPAKASAKKAAPARGAAKKAAPAKKAVPAKKSPAKKAKPARPAAKKAAPKKATAKKAQPARKAPARKAAAKKTAKKTTKRR